ncbi:hypothetical protein BO70DRAFT_390820 [Aspergillus heteromorphus CBS 117.55]|uniref:Alb1-domain-containing protein n=1 Tax=Aspergillus heteromorphus CBS 117.55 TaxID=1448321 RepID=A0A317UVV3_9EURO|nr:uncharacterized protein BO70DRAFT_390820 [Aspergillus heteromorphus CBS 117.55]PWY65576.1 hypothetical protein BO70DRAFT_390820 [Aspergillus heteromorphus CBS 117.55]
MAKSRPQSKHSRAARRAESPTLDVDKSLTSLPRAQDTTVQRESILSERANAGVSKKTSRKQSKSRAQRLRQQKGMDRAEAVVDQLEKKVNRSINRSKAVHSRKAEWEDQNRKAAATKSMFAGLNDEGDNSDDAMMDDEAPSKSKKRALQPVPAQNLVADEPAGIDVDEDIT